MKLIPNTNHEAIETVKIVRNNPGQYFFDHEEFTVYVGDHRILALSTENYKLAAKWTSEQSKTLRRGPVVVALSVDVHNKVFHFNMGCDSLLLHLPHYSWWRDPEEDKPPVVRAFGAFLSDDRVTVVGLGMAAVKKYLKEKWDLEVKNAVDLGAKAEELVPGTGKLSLEQMSTVFLRKDIDLEVVDEKLKNSWGLYSEEKVESAVVEGYVAYAVGVKLIAAAKDKSLLSTFRWKGHDALKSSNSLKPVAEEVEDIFETYPEDYVLHPRNASKTRKVRGKRDKFKSNVSLKAYSFGYEFL